MEKSKPAKIVTEKIEKIKEVTAPVDNIPVVSQKQFSERKFAFRVILLAIIGGTLGFIFLARQFPYFPFDLVITRQIQEFTPVWFDTLMNFVSFIGNPIPSAIMAILVVGFLFLKKRTKEARMLTISTISATLIAVSLKILIHRPRPTPDLIHQVRHFVRPDSFPSGHVLFFVGFFGFLFYLVYILPPKNAYRLTFLILLGGLICLVGLSRIYLGAHWFSDVLGAYLLGFLLQVGVIYLYNKWHPKVKES